MFAATEHDTNLKTTTYKIKIQKKETKTHYGKKETTHWRHFPRVRQK